MTEARPVTADFAVAAQIAPEDLPSLAAAGFRSIIKNRPEREAPDQPAESEIQAAAEAAGLRYFTLPFTGAPTAEIARAMADILAEAPVPTLAYCRTGTRSVTAWAAAQVLRGAKTPGEAVAAAAEAGYDLAGIRGMLESLSGSRA